MAKPSYMEDDARARHERTDMAGARDGYATETSRSINEEAADELRKLAREYNALANEIVRNFHARGARGD